MKPKRGETGHHWAQECLVLAHCDCAEGQVLANFPVETTVALGGLPREGEKVAAWRVWGFDVVQGADLSSPSSSISLSREPPR